jgi:hypothetical protein
MGGEANLLVSFFRDTNLLSSSSIDGFQPYILSAAKEQLPSRGSKNKGCYLKLVIVAGEAVEIGKKGKKNRNRNLVLCIVEELP